MSASSYVNAAAADRRSRDPRRNDASPYASSCAGTCCPSSTKTMTLSGRRDSSRAAAGVHALCRFSSRTFSHFRRCRLPYRDGAALCETWWSLVALSHFLFLFGNTKLITPSTWRMASGTRQAWRSGNAKTFLSGSRTSPFLCCSSRTFVFYPRLEIRF